MYEIARRKEEIFYAAREEERKQYKFLWHTESHILFILFLSLHHWSLSLPLTKNNEHFPQRQMVGHSPSFGNFQSEMSYKFYSSYLIFACSQNYFLPVLLRSNKQTNEQTQSVCTVELKCKVAHTIVIVCVWKLLYKSQSNVNSIP